MLLNAGVNINAITHHQAVILLACIDDFSLEKLCSLLDFSEIERSKRYHQAKDRKQYILSQALKRLVCAGYVEVPPKQLRFSFGEYGKPFCIDEGTPYFNISHSKNWVALGVCLEFELGVDIEFPRAIDYLSIMKKVCDERQLDQNSHIDEKGFLRIWTQKEAIAKALGSGLAVGMKNIPCNPEKESQYIVFKGKKFFLKSQNIMQNGVLSYALENRFRVDATVFYVSPQNIDMPLGGLMCNVLKSDK